MNKILVFLLLGFGVKAQSIYHKAFGDPKAEPILFLHGGPGGSAIDFELSTAEALSEKGYYVVLYDRRGEGRSDTDDAKYTLEQTFSDIDSLCGAYGIKSVNLLGHSFGGMLAVKYAVARPEKVKRIVLAAAPIDLQASLRAVHQRVAVKGDSAAKAQLAFVLKQDSASIYYSSGTFMLAMQNGVYTSPTLSEEGKARHAAFYSDPSVKSYMEKQAATKYKTMYQPSMGFVNNEKYTLMKLYQDFPKLQKIPVFGIYGKDDGLFDEAQLSKIATYSSGGYVLLDNCSHTLYLDAQEEFIELLTAWLR